MLPKNILVPVDFSANAERALDYACELAVKLDATVHVLHVVGIPALGVPELGVAVTASMIDQIVLDHQAALDKLVDKKRSGGARFGEVILRTGDARDTILQAAHHLGADLIVMGTHGRRGLSRMLLGSVAESVVRTSQCPVLTIRPHAADHPVTKENPDHHATSAA